MFIISNPTELRERSRNYLITELLVSKVEKSRKLRHATAFNWIVNGRCGIAK